MQGALDHEAKAESTSCRVMAPSSLAQTVGWSDLVWYVIGSVLFTAGGLGFVLSTTAYVQSWLWPFQFGAITWIIGSTAYLVPLVSACCASPPQREEGDRQDGGSRRRCRWGLGEAFSAICLLCFIVGCSLGFFGPEGIATETQVLENLPAINALFTVGSAVLLVNPTCLLLASCLSCRWRLKTAPEDGEVAVFAPLTVDWWYEAAAATSFTYASAAGGYGPNLDAMTSGMVFWVVGSVVLFVQAVHLIAVKSRLEVKTQCTDVKEAPIQTTEQSSSEEESPV
jgi:hypothetical protein